VVKRKDIRGGPIAQLQLAEYVSYMAFHGNFRDTQLTSPVDPGSAAAGTTSGNCARTDQPSS
jgi:hypothetical protein